MNRAFLKRIEAMETSVGMGARQIVIYASQDMGTDEALKVLGIQANPEDAVIHVISFQAGAAPALVSIGPACKS
jgi:hypothetical protein